MVDDEVMAATVVRCNPEAHCQRSHTRNQHVAGGRRGQPRRPLRMWRDGCRIERSTGQQGGFTACIVGATAIAPHFLLRDSKAIVTVTEGAVRLRMLTVGMGVLRHKEGSSRRTTDR